MQRFAASFKFIQPLFGGLCKDILLNNKGLLQNEKFCNRPVVVTLALYTNRLCR